MNWNTVWLIILATVIVAGVVLAGELISAHAQIAEFSPSGDTNQISTDDETKDNNDNNDNNGGSVGINPIVPPTNMTPPLRTYVMPNGSLVLVDTTSGELINVTTTPTGEELEENSEFGSGNGAGGGGQERGSIEHPQRQQQEPIRDPNELATSREEGSPENRLLPPR
jgi:hypothetical protein